MFAFSFPPFYLLFAVSHSIDTLIADFCFCCCFSAAAVSYFLSLTLVSLYFFFTFSLHYFHHRHQHTSLRTQSYGKLVVSVS